MSVWNRTRAFCHADTPPDPTLVVPPGSVQTLRGGPESSPVGKPDPDAAAPTRLKQQRQEEELAARHLGPPPRHLHRHQHPLPPSPLLDSETTSLGRFETCKSVSVLGSEMAARRRADCRFEDSPRTRTRPCNVFYCLFLVGGVKLFIGGRGHSSTECHPMCVHPSDGNSTFPLM